MKTPLRYGPKLRDTWAVQPHSQFAEIKLCIGITTSGRPRSVVTFEMYGIPVLVTDKTIGDHIERMTRVGQDATAVEPYLERLLFLALQQNPTYLEQRLKVEFERGLQEGRKQKVKEIRRALSD